MSELPDYVEKLLKDIATSEGFTDYTTKVKPGSNHGDGFLGIMTSVTLSGSRNNNGTTSEDTLHLLVKLAPTNEIRRREFQSALVFKREALMYTKILPLFAKFQKEKGLSESDSFTSYPKCYVAIADEEKDELVIIMEDLRPKGFTMWPKNKPVPSSHAFRVVEQLGKLHGISFALKDQRPDVYEELKEVNDLWSGFVKNDNMIKMMQVGFDRGISALERKDHIEIMTEVRDNIRECFEACLKEGACEPFGVIGHGDCWNNNLLYQYKEGTKEPKDICLVDWQISRYGSPALDLHYNLFSSTDKELRDKDYKNLMKHYHKTLSDIVTKLGSDPEVLFSYEDFEKQLKKFGRFAFVMAPMLVQMMMVDASDIPDLETLSEDMMKDENAAEFIKAFQGDTLEAYNKRVKDVITDLVDFGYYTH